MALGNQGLYVEYRIIWIWAPSIELYSRNDQYIWLEKLKTMNGIIFIVTSYCLLSIKSLSTLLSGDKSVWGGACGVVMPSVGSRFLSVWVPWGMSNPWQNSWEFCTEPKVFISVTDMNIEGSDVFNPALPGDWPWNWLKVTARTIGTKSWGYRVFQKWISVS